MTARKLPPVDIVIVGMGWAGGIMAKELGPTGLKIAVLERGGPRSTQDDFNIPQIRDELRFHQRTGLMMDTVKETLTVRNKLSEEALPMRRLGSFLPGEGVGGSGVHWNGVNWRWADQDLKIRSHYEQRYGKAYIPADMPLRDWAVSYAELEPFYEKFEYTTGVSGKAGNLKGKIQPGGNPFEAARAKDYPMPPLTPSLASNMFTKAATEVGFHPFPRPASQASQPWVNRDGQQLGQCQYCGFCERFGCESNSKGSPHITVIPVALRNQNVDLRTYSWVQKVLLDSTGKKATGVLYVNVQTGEELEQPADLVILSGYQLNNVHLLLLSGIGKPYDPQTRQGVVGANYCYQVQGGVTLFFEDRAFNPFISTGSLGSIMDDFHYNQDFDRSKFGTIGGATLAMGGPHGRPINYRPVPPGTPQWGSEWKRATAKWYQGAVNTAATGSVMPHADNCLTLDPTYKNRFGQPLLRMTFDFHDNDYKVIGQATDAAGVIAKAMNPKIIAPGAARRTGWSVVPYQTTHNTGGAIMGAQPGSSVVNKYGQSWDVPNVFVTSAAVFPHNSAYNPTGPVGALAFFAADAIKNRYLKKPGMLV